MEHFQILSVGFYIWWLLINGGVYIAEFHFIQSFTGIRGKKYVMPYVLLSDLVTFFVMYDQSPGVFRLILHIGIIFCFSKFLLGIGWKDTIAPAMIVLTLSTFMEGFQVIFMRWLVQQAVGEDIGIVIQMLMSGVSALLLIITLRFVSKKYAYTGQQKISSFLYVLLFPCIFIVWVIRSGLGLDMWMNQSAKEQTDLWAFAWILGTCVIFFIILKLVNKIIVLSVQETEQKRLEDQIEKQYVYLEEAKKRNEQYRMFQHDIHNHFLILSGLVHEKKYDEVEDYCAKLHMVSDKLLIGVDTGNTVIDILLNEKINFARSNGIEVKQDVHITSDCTVEDMDLCIILANAVDNAIQACVKEASERPEISIIVRKRHRFLIVEVTNTITCENTILSDEVRPSKGDTNDGMRSGYTFEYGTGLKNIKYIVKKYEGTMEIETSETYFRLTILLCLLPFTKAE